MPYPDDLVNGDFEDWVGNTPTGWTVGTNDSGSTSKETTIVKHGVASLKQNVCCYDAFTYAEQYISAIPRRGLTITVSAWGQANGNINSYLHVATDGTGALALYSGGAGSPWQEKTLSGVVPSDATYIRIYMRTYEPQYSTVGYWDWVTITPSIVTFIPKLFIV